MKITKKELLKKYGIDIPNGKYSIYIRNGNYEIYTVKDDTDGCILLGRTRRNNFVENSRDAVNEFIQKLKTALASGEECWIEIC